MVVFSPSATTLSPQPKNHTCKREDILPSSTRITVYYRFGTLNQAIKFGLLAINVADGATPPKPDEKPLQILRVAEFQAVLNVVKDHPYYPI